MSIFQIHSWRNYSESYKEQKNRSLSEGKHINGTRSEDTPWFQRRERRLSLEAVGAGVKLFNTSVNKPVCVVSRIATLITKHICDVRHHKRLSFRTILLF